MKTRKKITNKNEFIHNLSNKYVRNKLRRPLMIRMRGRMKLVKHYLFHHKCCYRLNGRLVML